MRVNNYLKPVQSIGAGREAGQGRELRRVGWVQGGGDASEGPPTRSRGEALPGGVCGIAVPGICLDPKC